MRRGSGGWAARFGSRRRWVLLAAGTALALAAILVVGQGLLLALDLVRARAELQGAAAAAERAFSGGDAAGPSATVVSDISGRVQRADGLLASARTRAWTLGPLLRPAARAPGWLGGFGDLPALIDAAAGLTGAAARATRTGEDLLRRVERGGPDPIGARLVLAFDAAEPELRAALADVEAARASRERVRADRLTGPLAPAGEALVTFDQNAPLARRYVAIAAEAPAALRALAGMDRPRTYAVLGQDSAEIRPTGGFIGAVAVVTVERGTITAQRVLGSYLLDRPERGYPAAPEPLAYHLGGDGWALRDTNWSPDFPTSAVIFQTLFAYHQDVRLDGVIGTTSATITLLLEALGPVQVDGLPEPVTAASWQQTLHDSIYVRDADGYVPIRADVEANKGSTLAPVLTALLARLQAASPDELLRTAQAVRLAVDRRELLLFLNDPAAARLARQLNATGRFTPPASGDVLALIDANVSYAKIAPYITTRLTYDVWLNERGAPERNELTVRYENSATPADGRRVWGEEWDPDLRANRASFGTFGTYARVYLPRDTVVVEVDPPLPEPLIGEDLGFTVLERYERVPVQSTREIRYRYQTPVNRNPPDRYLLRVLKQPGTARRTLEVRVHLPDGMDATSNLAMAREQGALVYRGPLIQDLALELVLRPSSFVPRP